MHGSREIHSVDSNNEIRFISPAFLILIRFRIFRNGTINCACYSDNCTNCILDCISSFFLFKKFLLEAYEMKSSTELNLKLINFVIFFILILFVYTRSTKEVGEMRAFSPKSKLGLHQLCNAVPYHSNILFDRDVSMTLIKF